MDETELISQAKRGDGSALSLLLKQHYPLLVKYLMKITMNPQLAEDLTQETMIRCVEKIGMYNGESKSSSWLITIATNMFIDHQRKLKRERRWQQDQEQALRKVKWQAARMNDEWSVILDALAQTPEEVRIPIVLKHYYGYSYEEVAKMLGIAEGTVKSRVSNGLEVIRRELSEHDGE